MDSPPSLHVDIFDEASPMEGTFCVQVSDNKFQEDVRSETDKALGDLCAFLDKNPEVYANILRKRKQEERECSGLFSYVKSKMLSVMQGEHYLQYLVSDADCMQQTNELKVGMCKTFQYAQDLKGNVTRHSARLAAKRQAEVSVADPVNPTDGSISECLPASSKKHKNKDTNVRLEDSDVGQKEDDDDLLPVSEVRRRNDDNCISKDCDVRLKVNVIDVKKVRATRNKTTKLRAEADTTQDESTGENGCKKSNSKSSVAGEAGNLTDFVQLDGLSPADDSTAPPLPPPLPPHAFSALVPTTPLASQSMSKKSALSNSKKSELITNTPKKAQVKTSKSSSTSVPVYRENGVRCGSSQSLSRARADSTENLSPSSSNHTVYSTENLSPSNSTHNVPVTKSVRTLSQSKSTENLSQSKSTENLSSLDGEFLTPMFTSQMFRNHKRSLSTTSTGSLNNIHSELTSSNPITRLKATQIARSPGGTPVRSKSSTMPSEPLQKALYTAMRSKFQNVNTPSPKSDRSSVSSNNNSTFNSTFSP